MTEEIKFKEVENGCKVSVPLFTNLELEELDYNIKTHYDEIIKRIFETVSRDKDIIVLKRVIQKQDTEINKLKAKKEYYKKLYNESYNFLDPKFTGNHIPRID